MFARSSFGLKPTTKKRQETAKTCFCGQKHGTIGAWHQLREFFETWGPGSGYFGPGTRPAGKQAGKIKIFRVAKGSQTRSYVKAVLLW
jgi:hypothetical protein